MGISWRQKSKRIYAIIVALLWCELMLAETYGIVGHAHSLVSSTHQSEQNGASNPQRMGFFASDQGSNKLSCSLCYCYKLLGQSLVPQLCRSIDLSFAVQPILVHRIRLMQCSAIKTESRSPPQS
jgi:hypothetical protein